MNRTPRGQPQPVNGVAGHLRQEEEPPYRHLHDDLVQPGFGLDR